MDAGGETPLVWIEAEALGAHFLPEPFPPREHRGSLGPLVRSVRDHGCICPIIARPQGEKLQVVCGYRRLMAAQAARVRAVPVLVRALSDEESRRLFNEENFHRVPHPASGQVRGGRPPEGEARGPDSLDDVELGAILDAEAGSPFRDAPPVREDQAASLRRIIEKQRKASVPEGPIPLRAAPGQLDFTPEPAGDHDRTAAEAQILPVILGGILATDRLTGIPGGGSPDGGAAHGAVHAAAEAPRPGKEVPDFGMLSLLRRTSGCFVTIRKSRFIPVEEMEAIASDLIDMAPLRRGKDLRLFVAGGPSMAIAGHSLLVAGLGIHLVEALEWTPGQVKKFALACLLHDVGMLFMPPELVGAARPLDRDERQTVERHVDLGGEIIQGSHAWGAQICLVARDHHERWNGMGYPRRKKGKEVDLPARLVAFLDCYGALVSPRPHRAPLLYSQALRAMAALTEIGLHDPSILVHFRNVFTELPGGSFLRLVDGRVGRVVGRDPRSRRRYRLRLIDGLPPNRPEPPVWVDAESIAREIHPRYEAIPGLAGEPAPETTPEPTGSLSTP